MSAGEADIDTPEPDDAIARLEARVDALSATIKSVLSTLVLRGVLNRAEVPALLRETEAAMRGAGAHAAALAELRAIEGELPGYMRAAVGPPPDPDDDDH